MAGAHSLKYYVLPFIAKLRIALLTLNQKVLKAITSYIRLQHGVHTDKNLKVPFTPQKWLAQLR